MIRPTYAPGDRVSGLFYPGIEKAGTITNIGRNDMVVLDEFGEIAATSKILFSPLALVVRGEK